MRLKMVFLIITFLNCQLFSCDMMQANQLVEHVQKSINNAENGISKLSPDVLKIDGKSSKKVRYLLNNLCSLPQTRYLEIGCWKGSTWIAALYGNVESIDEAVAIDNWSEFDGPKDVFLLNCYRFLQGISYRFYSQDCFSIDPRTISKKPINIYFYDGNHSEWSQEHALTHYDPIFSDEFILIVDDWNYQEVQNGTYQALAKLNYTVIYSTVLPARFNADVENWWNGLYIAVICKKP